MITNQDGAIYQNEYRIAFVLVETHSFIRVMRVEILGIVLRLIILLSKIQALGLIR